MSRSRITISEKLIRQARDYYALPSTNAVFTLAKETLAQVHEYYNNPTVSITPYANNHWGLFWMDGNLQRWHPIEVADLNNYRTLLEVLLADHNTQASVG